MKLTEKQVAALEKQAAAGADARAFLDGAKVVCPTCRQDSTIFNERKTQIIKEAIDWFESPHNASDSHVAVRYVAALAEIVKLENALLYRVKKADDARETMYGGDQTAG